MDIDVCVSAAVEDRPVVGVRRSTRLSGNAGARQSLHIGQLLQEQTEEEAVLYFSEIGVLYDVRSASGLRVSGLSRFQTSESSSPRVSLPRTLVLLAATRRLISKTVTNVSNCRKRNWERKSVSSDFISDA